MTPDAKRGGARPGAAPQKPGPDLDALLAAEPIAIPDHVDAVWSIVEKYFRLGRVPVAFSPAWFELPEDDPRRFASIILSAFARWAEEMALGGPVARVEKEVSAAVCAAGAGRWAEYASPFTAPALETLRRRRPQSTPRPGDHPGGPVPVWGPRPAARTAAA